MLCRLSYTQISSQQHGAPQEAKVTAIRGTFNTSQASIVRNIQLDAWSSTLFQLLPRKSQISLATISQDELRKLQQDIDRETTSTEARELAAFRRIHIPDQGIGIFLVASSRDLLQPERLDTSIENAPPNPNAMATAQARW
jgi:hypothetical protein